MAAESFADEGVVHAPRFQIAGVTRRHRCGCPENETMNSVAVNGAGLVVVAGTQWSNTLYDTDGAVWTYSAPPTPAVAASPDASGGYVGWYIAGGTLVVVLAAGALGWVLGRRKP
jgi:hypothetical protein